ncbi:MAG: BTAD domain-containing putative transcriptional regulator, partial [Brevefilum sp.]|nr:BTAD domain-containing putative transcriptional regulator [Brevefilum sp.]
MLEIKTLGGFSIGIDGHEIKTLNSHKAQALLIYLLVEGRVQQRSVLATLFWPENTQEEACRSLRVALSKLRKHVGDYIDITRDSVSVIDLNKIQFDFDDFQRKLVNGKIDAALEIYKGEFLEGFSIKGSELFEDWMRNTADLINSQMLEILQGALQDAIVNEDYFNAERYAREILEQDPLNENAHQQSILLFAITGNRAAALSQYQLYRDILQNELNLEPSEETREIYEKILQGDILEKGTLLRKIKLPTPTTSFIGREQEIQQLSALIRKPTCRLITIIGQGGIGKTRLSIEAARKCARYFFDGVFFVPVEACPSIDHLILAMAKSLELTIDVVINAAGAKTQVLEYLYKRSCLLILDSFEHLVNSVEFLVELLNNAPKVKLIVNSRQSLELKSEWIFHLEGLAYQSPGEIFFDDRPDAVKLFIARAQQSDSRTLNFDDQQQLAVKQICEFVEGMPLGIEMAAAWNDLLQPSKIAQEIQKSLDFLTTNKKDVPEKHQSLRVIFDHTWQGLGDKDKLIYCKMAVFKGEFDLQAAQYILETDLTQLSRLLDRSLLMRNQSGYFSLHALAHQYASEKLMQQKELFQETYVRFYHYYVELMIQQQEALLGADMMRARDEIKPFLINIQAALLLACKEMQKKEFMKVLTASLAFYTVYGWHEGLLSLQQLERTRRKFLIEKNTLNVEMDEILLTLRSFQAFWLVNLGNIEEAQKISSECLPMLNMPEMEEPLSICLHNLGVVASFRGELDESMRLLEEAVLLGRKMGCIFWPTYLFWLGHAYFLKG